MRAFPLLFVLGGCLGSAGPLEGVWMMEATNPVESCSTTYTTNVRDADLGDEPGEPGPWTDLGDHAESLDIFFVRIAHGRSDDTVMLVGDAVIPGEQLDKTTWQFEYVAEVTDVTGERHESGYTTTETSTTKVTNAYTVRRVGNRYIEGEADFDSEVIETWEETDEWDDTEVGYSFGDLPSFYVGGSDNLSDDDTCTDAICRIERRYNCQNDANFVGTFTGLNGDSTFDIEDNSSNPGF